MEKELNQCEIKEEEMEQVTGGSLTEQLLKRKQFQQEQAKKQAEQKQKEQTVFSDETGAWGGW